MKKGTLNGTGGGEKRYPDQPSLPVTHFALVPPPPRDYDLNITINNKTLKLSESVKYLGVTLDHFLNWKLHIKNLCSKLSSANGAISRLRYYVPNSTLIQIYYALFFSHLNYACQIWGQIDNQGLQRILMLQKKCVRLMTFSDFF